MADREIHIPFNTGFDDFTDDRWKPDGHIKSAVNCEWNQEGRIEKRRGFEAFSESGVSVGTLWNYGDTFVSMSADGLAIYNPQQDSLTTTRAGAFLDVKTYQAASVLDITDPQASIAYSAGIYMVAWAQATTGDLYACFYDATSKRPLTEVYRVDVGTFTHVTAHAFNGFFAIVASDGDTGGQYVYRNPTALPVHSNWTIESLGLAFTHANGIDAYADDDTIYVVGHQSGSTAILRVVKTLISAAGVVSTTNLIWSLGQTQQWQINAVPSGFGIVGIVAVGGAIAHCVIDTTPAYVFSDVALGFTAMSVPTIGPTADATYSECITAYQPGVGTGIEDLLVIFYDPVLSVLRTKRSGATYPRLASWVDPVTSDQIIPTRRVERATGSTIGDAFTTSALAFCTLDEITNYNAIDAYRIGLKCRYGSIGVQGAASINLRANRAVETSTTKRAWVEVAKVQNSPPSFMIQIAEAEAAPAIVGRGAELAAGFYCSRGPTVFDGLQLAELGFYGFPKNRILSPTIGGGSLTGLYLYQLTWEITNALGDTTRSAPKITEEANVAGADNAVDIAMQSIAPTNWGVRNDFGIDPYTVFYRDQAAGQTFYRVKTQTQNDESAYDTGSYTDTISDINILTNPVVYTDGAQLPPLETVLPPCLGDICVYKNRIIGVADDGITLWVSTDKRPSEQVRFNEAMNIQIADGGRIFAICAEQDRILLFKQQDIYVVYGEGADERGVGSSFNLPVPLAQNIGCTRSESVLATPVGTFFQGGPGIMRVVGQQIDFIGNAVRDTFPGVVSAVAHSAEQQKVFFACHNEALTTFMILVFDYRFQRWTEWTYSHPSGLTGENKRIIGMVVYDGRLHCSLGDRVNILRQKEATSASSHLDFTNTWVEMSVQFAPIKTSGPQGFQHVKKVMFIGEQGSRHNLTVELANNYQSADYQSVTWTGAVIDTWSTLPIEQFSAKPAQPRCEAIRVTVSDAAPSTGASGTGQGIKLVGLSLTVADKTRLMRLGAPFKR